MLYLLKYKGCGAVFYVEKARTKFRYRFTNCKSKHRAFRKCKMKVTRERSHTHYCLDGYTGTNGWDILILEQYEVYEQLKERETFWQHGIETFYPIGLKKKRSTVFTRKSTSLELASPFWRKIFNEHLPGMSGPFFSLFSLLFSLIWKIVIKGGANLLIYLFTYLFIYLFIYYSFIFVLCIYFFDLL